MSNPTARYQQISRVPLGHLPTPLEPLDRLSEELGGPRIWLKRDDCTGLATGGNKTRKLEYLLADADAGQHEVVTFGAVQSNHARQTAAACAQLGIPCHLILSRRVDYKARDYESGGNVTLDRLFGAHIHFVEPDAVEAKLDELRQSISSRARQAIVIPSGGSNALGALGYVRALEELLADAERLNIKIDQIWHASASAGTQAGLCAGAAWHGLDTTIHGVNVYHDNAETLERRVSKIALECCETYLAPAQPDVIVAAGYRGEGYGIPTEDSLKTIKLAARLEGIAFDPVYSGKGFHGLADQISIGALRQTRNVVFIHTGGQAALSVYQQEF